MSALTVLTDAGIDAFAEPTGGLKLKGLSRLTKDQRSQLIDYARNHKPAILSELKSGSAQKVFLPSACPIVTSQFTPGVELACRFDPRILNKLILEGIITRNAGCPLKSACGLMSSWPRVKQPRRAQSQCLGTACELVSYKEYEGMTCLWCGQVGAAVIDIETCPCGNWERGLKVSRHSCCTIPVI